MSFVKGPGEILDLRCIYVSQDAAMEVTQTDDVIANVQVFAKSISENETARLEAQDAAAANRARVDSAAFKAGQKGPHCQRCRESYAECIEDLGRGKQPTGSSTCLGGFVECLSEDRGDGQVTAAKCPIGAQ